MIIQQIIDSPSSLIILVVTALFILVVMVKFRRQFAPETLRSVVLISGIFGTFLSIIVGLHEANLSDLQNLHLNISDLLGKVAVAFITSLVGMLASLWILLKPKAFAKEEKKDGNEDLIAETDEQILHQLKLLNKNIAGDSETSLSTQLLKIKDSFNTKQDELKQSFDKFAEKMADNNMKALEEVIKDFNTKLQEQFGENFKQLNEAVGRLLTWQENYSSTIEETQTKLRTVVEALETMNKSVQLSVESLEKIKDNVNSFKENSDALKEQLEEARNTIMAISELSNKLDGAAEIIRSNIEGMTKDSIEALEKSTNQILQDIGQNLKGISEALAVDYEKVAKKIREISNS